MHAERTLDRLQRWMLEVVSQPGSVREALGSESARREIDPELLPEIILPSSTLTAERRIGIYHDMYVVRMIEALEFDFPGVSHFLGHRRFHRLVEGYVVAHPSRSYTLNRLGDHFADYLASLTGMPRRPFLTDLARLELAITLVFDAARDEALEAAAIVAVPAESWPSARFLPISAFRLLALDYPVDDYLQSVKLDGEPPPLRKSPRLLLMYRNDYSVRRVNLPRREWMMLSALADGLSLGDAVARLSRLRPSLSETELFGWFRDWTKMGLFTGIELE